MTPPCQVVPRCHHPFRGGTIGTDTTSAALSDLLEAAFDDLGIVLTSRQRRDLKAHLADLLDAHHLALVDQGTTR